MYHATEQVMNELEPITVVCHFMKSVIWRKVLIAQFEHNTLLLQFAACLLYSRMGIFRS